MKPITRYAVSVLLLLLCVQIASWAAVQVAWTDAAGSHVVGLTLESNPEHTADPLTLEPLLAWQGSIDIVMANGGPIELDFSGNFYGQIGYNDGVWKLIRVDQHVLNATGRRWDGFEITCRDPNPDPDPGIETSFYNAVTWEPHWGDVFVDTQSVSYIRLDGEPYVEAGGEFYDIIKVWANTDVDDDGGVILTKQPSMVIPEPASLVALIAGFVGMIGFSKRR